MPKSPHNILVVRTDRMGDVVLTLPVFRVLRMNFPDSRITALVAEATKDLVDGHPDVDEVITVDRRSRIKGSIEFVKLVLRLRSRTFDWVLVFHTKKWTNALCFFAGIPRRSGYRNEKWGNLLTEPFEDPREAGRQHESEFCLGLLEKCGLKMPAEKNFNVPKNESAEVWIKKWAQRHDLEVEKAIVINPSASDPARQWPAPCFSALIEKICLKTMGPVIIIGTKQDKHADTIRAAIKSDLRDQVYKLSGQTTLAQLISLIRLSRLLVSNDSGPVHIASALDKPVVSIFTRDAPGVNPERWGPLGVKSRMVVTPYKQISSRIPSILGANKPDSGITVESVWEAVDGLLKLC